jgi:hypothetical protein
MRGLRVLFMSASCIGCYDNGLPPAEDEFAGTGGMETEGPGPLGPGCDENWYSVDGPPVEPQDELPEFASPANRALVEQRIEFSGPPPAVVHGVGSPIPKTAPLEPLSWEEFVAKFARPTEGGWFVEMDLFRTPEELHRDYAAYSLRAKDPDGPKSSHTLIGFNEDDVDEVWSGPRKLALTWCVGWVRPSPVNPDDADLHAERYNRIVRAVEESARAWERIAHVNFVHLREFDDPDTNFYSGGDCQPGQDGVFFRVRMDVANGCEGPCKGLTNVTPVTELEPEWASPENPDGWDRELLISASSLAQDSEAQTTARHELGHVLGFEHEHIRPAFPGEECKIGGSDWRELTPPDPKSVMAYDFCPGVSPNQPRLSAYDRLGAFYQYNWSRRQSLLLSAVSPIDEFSYDGTGRGGIAWHDASGSMLHLWTSVAEPGEPINFDVDQHCLDGGEFPCAADVVWSHRVRPSPLYAEGSAANLDLFLYGSGDALDDVLLNNAGPMFDAALVDTQGHKVPIVGAFSDGLNDQIIFHEPGPGSDVLWEPATGATFPVEYSDYAYPLLGRYRGFGGGASDILWYQPENGTFEVWQWLDYGPEYNYLPQGAADASPHGIEAGGDYVPLIGDFDGDDRTDIFWYAPGETADSLWLSISNQDVVIFESYPHQVEGQYQSFVGDFNGDEVHDILWYSVADELEGGLSGIWYFDVTGAHAVRTFSVHGDYTPVVADFDDDGCTDVMWYDATSDNPQSPVWRCIPGESDFECDPPRSTPPRTFPIGYGGSFQ